MPLVSTQEPRSRTAIENGDSTTEYTESTENDGRDGGAGSRNGFTVVVEPTPQMLSTPSVTTSSTFIVSRIQYGSP